MNNKLLSSPSVMQKLFNYGVASKVAEVEAGVVKNDTVWDKVFFRKIQDKLGGRVKVSYVSLFDQWLLHLDL